MLNIVKNGETGSNPAWTRFSRDIRISLRSNTGKHRKQSLSVMNLGCKNLYRNRCQVKELKHICQEHFVLVLSTDTSVQ